MTRTRYAENTIILPVWREMRVRHGKTAEKLRQIAGLGRFAFNLHHLTLPEIKDFNALGDNRCFK